MYYRTCDDIPSCEAESADQIAHHETYVLVGVDWFALSLVQLTTGGFKRLLDSVVKCRTLHVFPGTTSVSDVEVSKTKGIPDQVHKVFSFNFLLPKVNIDYIRQAQGMTIDN